MNTSLSSTHYNDHSINKEPPSASFLNTSKFVPFQEINFPVSNPKTFITNMSQISSANLISKKPTFILHNRSKSKEKLKPELSASNRRLKTTLLGSRDFQKQKV